MEQTALIQLINAELDLDVTPAVSFAELKGRIESVVRDLIRHNMTKLAGILYRVDVNERKLKYLLQEKAGLDAAVIITELIIDRQLEKIALRKKYTPPPTDIPDEEKW